MVEENCLLKKACNIDRQLRKLIIILEAIVRNKTMYKLVLIDVAKLVADDSKIKQSDIRIKFKIGFC